MKDCILFGNGKSLENFEFKKINRDMYDIIGFCLAFRYWDKIDWYPDIYVCVDTVVLNNNDLVEWLIKDKCKKYLLSNCILKNDKLARDINMSKVVFIEDLVRNNNSAFHGINVWCSGSAGLLFSVDCKYKNINLFGFDCDYVEFIPESQQSGRSLIITKTPEYNPNYFFNDYQRKGDKYNIPHGKVVHLKSWANCSEIIKNLNKNQINYIIKNYNNKKSISDYFKTYTIDEFEQV